MFDVSSSSCRAVQFDKLDTAKIHGLETSNVSCRFETWRSKWHLGFIGRKRVADFDTHFVATLLWSCQSAWKRLQESFRDASSAFTQAIAHATNGRRRNELFRLLSDCHFSIIRRLVPASAEKKLFVPETRSGHFPFPPRRTLPRTCK